MTTKTQLEIATLEERLKRADIKNDPGVFADLIADDAVMTDQEGKLFGKQEVVDAHQPPGAQKFTRFDVSDLKIKDLGPAAIVTCRVDLKGKGFGGAMRFTRFWLKQHGRWQIVGGHISLVLE